MVQSIKVPWNVQIFRYNTIQLLSNCFAPQTWKIWAGYRPSISDIIGYNRAVLKTFAAHYLSKFVVSRMSQSRLHVTSRDRFLYLFLREQAKLFTNSLDQHERIVILANIKV